MAGIFPRVCAHEYACREGEISQVVIFRAIEKGRTYRLNVFMNSSTLR